jgi:copper(I)-binding protein
MLGGAGPRGRRGLAAAAGIGLTALLVACSGGSGEITGQSFWARATLGGGEGRGSAGSHGNAAIYGSVVNGTGTDDRLLAASISPDVAREAQIHTVRREGDSLRMELVPALALPRGEQLTFAPGDLHIMLVDLVEPLRRGDGFLVTLRFERAGDLAFEVEVRADAP